MSYKKGDWVVLGHSGSGWAPSFQGAVVQIAEIGKHLSLHCSDYDFYIEPINYYLPQNRKLGKSNYKDCGVHQIEHPRGGGNSKAIERPAYLSEISINDALLNCLKL